MNPDQYNAITTTLATLVASGEGINEHLRLLNGKVAKHEETINTIIIWKAKAEGFGSAINVGWTTIITLVGGAFAIFVYWTTRK